MSDSADVKPVDAKPADAVAAPEAKPETTKSEKPAETPPPVPEKKPEENKPAGKDEKPEANKPSDEEKTDKIVPEKYDLKVPENSPLNAKRVEKLSQLAKEKGLSNEEAQALLDSEHESLSEYIGHQFQDLKNKSEQWLKESKADKEIGGEKFNETVEVAHRAVEHFFKDTGIKEFLDKSGYGNKPDIIKGFYAIGKQMLQNDKIVTTSSKSPERPPITKRLYDHPTSQQT